MPRIAYRWELEIFSSLNLRADSEIFPSRLLSFSLFPFPQIFQNPEVSRIFTSLKVA